MLVRVTCACKKSWFVDDSLAGTPVACKSCGGSVVVPGEAPATPAAAPAGSPASGPWNASPGGAYPAAPHPPAAPVAVAGDSFLAYQVVSGLGGENRLYRVYRVGGALAFLRLGPFVDGVDYGALVRYVAQGGKEAPGASRAELRFRARLAAVDAMTERERALEAARAPNFLAPAAKMTQVRVEPAEGFGGPWASNPFGQVRAWLRFRLSGRKVQVELRDPNDLRLVVHWLWELLGTGAVLVTVPMEQQYAGAPAYPPPAAPGSWPTAPAPYSQASQSPRQSWAGIVAGVTVGVALALGRSGCSLAPAISPPPYVAASAFPELGPPSEIRLQNTLLPADVGRPSSIVRFNEVTLSRGGRRTRLWIYRPAAATSTRLPCVLIAPAGTRLVHGMELGDGDRPEHAPYVRAGMVVVAYELDGPAPDGAWLTDSSMVRAASEFMASEAGLRNAQDALNYALKRVPEVDPYRIYAAGHSSAATAALHLAQHEPRIKAVAAYAPCTDVEGRLGGEVIGPLDRRIKGFRKFIHASSPLRNAALLRCPVFLFHAEDDNNVPIRETEAFAAEVRKTNPNVTFHRVPRGGHYDSMLEQGVPQAIGWMRQLPNVRRWHPVDIGLFSWSPASPLQGAVWPDAGEAQPARYSTRVP